MSDIEGSRLLESPTYTCKAMPIWRRLLRHTVARPDSLARLSAGNSSAARMAMIEITTNSSISVKALIVFVVSQVCGVSLFRECTKALASSPSPRLEERAGERRPCLITVTVPGMVKQAGDLRPTKEASEVTENNGLLSLTLSSRGGEGTSFALE